MKGHDRFHLIDSPLSPQSELEEILVLVFWISKAKKKNNNTNALLFQNILNINI